MTPERWHQISRIFKSAISLDGEARAAYVADQCGVDRSLRAEVEKLIDSHRQANKENFIEGVAAEAAAAVLLEHDDVEEHRSRLQKGQEIGSYQILELLGAGGMGEVYRARDSRLDRTVALKILSQDLSADKRRMQRFRQEAKMASSLNQPNILTVYEFGEIGSLTFLATEFIDGETLRNYLQAPKLNLREILDIGIQMLAALDSAHEAHIIHRDIKPENVMIRRRDRVVKVLDFGLAKLTERASTLLTAQPADEDTPTEVKTVPGSLMGTIAYMSPEQAQLHKLDERTDIWSTGVMIYEMVTGMLPFKGATNSHTIVQILEQEPLPLSRIARVPQELERIVLKAMAKSLDDRYQTAKDMLIDLRNLKTRLDVEVEMGRTSSPDMTKPLVTVETIGFDRERQKKRVLAGALAAMALFAAAVFGIYAWRSSRVTTVNPVAAPIAERKLAYWVTVQKFRDMKPYQDPFTLAGEINFELDYHIRVNVRSPQAGHLYILNEGPAETSQEPEFVVVFPSPTANQGAALLRAEQLVQIPERTWLKFDAQQGVETLWLVFAEDAIPELESVKAFANPRDKGLITDVSQTRVVKDFLHKSSLPKATSEKSDKETTVKAPGKLLVHAIKLEHH